MAESDARSDVTSCQDDIEHSSPPERAGCLPPWLRQALLPRKKIETHTVDVKELVCKLMTQQLQYILCSHALEKLQTPASGPSIPDQASEEKCQQLLAHIFGEALVKEHNKHINVEVGRLAGEYKVQGRAALLEVFPGCRKVTQEEVKAMDAQPTAGEPESKGESDPERDEGDSSYRCAILLLRLAVLG
jgi:hypothetical protein